MLLEICVDSIDSALAAQAGGAQRLELCQALGEGGLTPSYGLLEHCLSVCQLPIMMMIRPRAGGFVYSEAELEVMKRDIGIAKELGVQGVVLGVLKANHDIDLEKTRALVDLARPLGVTFHRAFDLTPDPYEALETLIDLGIERVLSSGQASGAILGLGVLKGLHDQAAGRITVIAGAGINEDNLAEILATGISEIHASASSKRDARFGFGSSFQTHVEKVKALLAASQRTEPPGW